MAAEHEQVEIELSRSPALALLTPERPLEPLQGNEQRDGGRLRIRAARDVEGDDGVPELRLIDEAHGLGRIEPRDPDESDAGQRCQRADAGRERRRRIAEIRAEPDVGSNRPTQRWTPAR